MAAERSRLVLVSAPAGYGKSTLVAQWCDLDPRPGCSVRLGHGDNDPVVLLLHVVAALERTGLVDRELLEEFSGQPPRIDEVALPLLAAELGDRDPFVLVLDDVDVITAARSRAILAFLVDEVPAGSQLVLVTRGDPGVPLGRLRAGGDLVEIGTELLALDAQETRDVAASGGLELSEVAAEALRKRTEGWAAAVVLAALSLRGRDDAGARAAGLSADQTQIADYLVEEVLEGQPELLKRFLLGTSTLERMTASLCDAVLGTTDAAASLEALARSNAFVVPIDDRREWYRYHHLFGDLLRAELGRRHPKLLSVYRRRAARWCELHRAPGEAFLYAYESRELAQAGRIALAHREELARHGQSESVRLWLERCTEEKIASDPQLSLAAAWVFLFMVMRPGRDSSSRRPRGGRSMWHPPTDRRRFDHHSRLSELSWLPTASPRCCAMVSSSTRPRSRRAPDGLPAAVARREWRTFSWAGRSWRSPCCGRHSRFRSSNPSPPTRGWSISGIWHLGPRRWAIGETCSDGRSKPPGWWPKHTSRRPPAARSPTPPERSLTSSAVTTPHQQRGDHTAVARELESVRRLRRHVHAAWWLNADLALRCAGISLDIGDPVGALEFGPVADDALQGYPDAGTLPARVRDLEARIRRGQDYRLTSGELRVLSFQHTSRSRRSRIGSTSHGPP
jgi:AAA ATPase domain